MTLTRRQRIAQLLRESAYSVEDVARYVGSSPKVVQQDLEHVRRGLKAPERWIFHPSECVACGFRFEGRERLNTPSRCPQCRSEEIQDPLFEIDSES